MIKSFAHKGLREFYESGSKKGIQPEHAPKLGRMLDRLDASISPQDMNLPGYRLHPLKGDKQDMWAVTVNGNWRLTFYFEGRVSPRLPRLSLEGGTCMTNRKPTHPGAVLLEDVIKPLGLTITEAAKMLGVSRKTLSEFVNEKAMLSPDMAIRIAKATNTSPESWMNMQQKLTLWEAEQHLPENVIPFPSVHSEEAATLQM